MTPPLDHRRAADAPGHREAQEALPWLANRTLAGTELERVWSHVQACPQCRADLALMHTWRHALQAAGTDLPGCDTERALARLKRTFAPSPASAPVPAQAVSCAAAPADLVVLFRPETPERELRRIVRALGARIVGGPTAGDTWLLATAGDPDPVRVRLHAESAVCWVEPFTRRRAP